jgi:hypothetical protein
MDRTITIVSGLPRSGTSMMMKMLEAGGMSVVVDHIRKADEDNPLGYYEFEKVKKVREDPSWLKDTQGKVFKMVSMLLYDLPLDTQYKVIFMQREMDEILASQRKMLERRGSKGADVSSEEMGRLYLTHLKEIERWLGEQPGIDVLYMSYNKLVENPRENIQKVNWFLDNRLDVEQMVKVVDKSLYRQRNTSGGGIGRGKKAAIERGK